MRDAAPFVCFFDETGMDESPRMLGDRLHVPLQSIGNAFYGDARIRRDREQYVDAPMVGDSFEMPLESARILRSSDHHIAQLYTNILKNVGMFPWEFSAEE